MSNRVLLKKSSVAAKVPLTSDLEYGELAINYNDEKIYFKNSSGAVKAFSAAATVSSVSLSLPAIFTVSGSPLTTSGTLTATLANATANTVFAGLDAATGTPAFRALVSADLPSSYSPTGTLTLGTANQTTTMLGNISAITSNQTVTLSPTGSTGTVTIAPVTLTGNINNMNIGATTRGTGAFTTFGATGVVTVATTTNNQSYSTTGAGTITISSGTLGSIDNMTIGGTTPAVVNFSQLVNPTTAVSSTAWTTTGVNIKSQARTYTDSSSVAGTIAASYINVIGAPTFASTNAITITEAANLYVSAPVAGTNSTLTGTGFSIVTGGRIKATDFTGTIGATTASTGAFTTLSATSTVSGTGFSTYLASPPAIGGTTANTGAFTTLSGTLTAETYSTNAAVSAAGTTQATGTALTNDYNIITSAAASSGVVLPTATTGRRIIVVNKGANALAVYPATGGTIDALSVNTAISVPVSGWMEFNASSTTQWYSTYNITAAGGGSMVYPGTGIPNSTGTAWGTSYTTSGSGTTVALTASPVFTTPLLGTPSSGTLTGCNFGGTTNQIVVQTGVSTTGVIAAPTVDATYLKWNTAGGFSWATVTGGGGLTTTDDNATNATYYPVFVTAAGGSTAKTASTDLTFNPSSGTLSATLFQSLSDKSKKTNIIGISGAINTVKKLNGVEFDWIDNGFHSSGVIAQEIEQILPHLVQETDGIKSVNYSGLIGYLIEAIKELSDKIDNLENK